LSETPKRKGTIGNPHSVTLRCAVCSISDISGNVQSIGLWNADPVIDEVGPLPVLSEEYDFFSVHGSRDFDTKTTLFPPYFNTTTLCDGNGN
jgi:hypothetical protein